MQTISSAAGTRLARAKARLDAIRQDDESACEELVIEYESAADAVADELIEQGFHEMEGE